MPAASKSNVEFMELPVTVADPDLYAMEIPFLVVQVCPSPSEAVEPVLVMDTWQFDPLSVSLLAVSAPPDPAILMVVISVSVMGEAPGGEVKVSNISSEQAHLPTKGSVVPPPVVFEVESPVQATQAMTQKRRPSILSLLMKPNPPPNKENNQTSYQPTCNLTNLAGWRLMIVYTGCGLVIASCRLVMGGLRPSAAVGGLRVRLGGWRRSAARSLRPAAIISLAIAVVHPRARGVTPNHSSLAARASFSFPK
jgi:hypothetical protein